MAVLQRKVRPNGHAPKGELLPSVAQCPTCDSPISAEKFAEIQGTLRAHEAAIERGAEARLGREIARVEAGRKADITKAVKEATAISEKKLELIRKNQNSTIAAHVQAEREAAVKRQTEAVNSERLAHAAEKIRLETALAEMQRKLAAKPAHQIGEPAEVDLYDALAAAFPGDRVHRVRKGAKGADVVVEIVHQEMVVGKIVFDSKNYSPRRWSNAMTKKLRADQLAEGADFAVLSSNVFPAGAQELHLQDNVIVASPQRVLVLTHLLRRQIVENYRHRLTTAARDEKAEKLLAYIVSPTCIDLLDRIASLTCDLADLDRLETAAHQRTWTKRADLIRAFHAIHEEFSSAISAIITGEKGPAS